MLRMFGIVLMAAGMLPADVNEDLITAARKGDAAAVSALLEKGAAIETTTAYGQTPLYLAAIGGHEAVVRALLEKGAKVDVRDTFYKAPMTAFALQRKHYGIVKILIEKGTSSADENLAPMVQSGRLELVQAVLEKGKPSQKALDRAYEMALEQKQPEIVEALNAAGAVPPKLVAVDLKVLESYAGTYKSDQFPLAIRVFVKEGKLGMQAGAQPELVMRATSPTQYEFVRAGIEVEFDTKDSFTLKQGGRAMPFKKEAAQ
jgi:ankyrin repeat protein